MHDCKFRLHTRQLPHQLPLLYARTSVLGVHAGEFLPPEHRWSQGGGGDSPLPSCHS